MFYIIGYQMFSGQPITLEHPYMSQVPEPSVYDDISRHAVCGKTFNWRNSSTCNSDSSAQEPEEIDWSVSAINTIFPCINLQVPEGSNTKQSQLKYC